MVYVKSKKRHNKAIKHRSLRSLDAVPAPFMATLEKGNYEEYYNIVGNIYFSVFLGLPMRK
jgi:hypothetical protein